MADNKPLIDLASLQNEFGSFTPPTTSPIPNLIFKSPSLAIPASGGEESLSALSAIENSVLSKKHNDGKLRGGGIPRTLAEVSSDRYDAFLPDYNNEDAYAQGQGWPTKMVNGIGKGISLTGTTLLQSTVGLVNGVARAIDDGRAASFYDNDFNRALDEWNKKLEDALPNYYTDVEKSANWYSPKKLLTANFFWDEIVKNLGFSAGAALSGGVYATALKAIPLTARLFSIGKAAEALAATEEGLLSAGKAAETYGKIKNLSDKFLSSYNLLNPGGRALIAGLATTGEAGFEAYNNLNEFRNQKIQEYKDANNGKDPIGKDLEDINNAADSVGNSSFLLNTGLLSATNYIQFPKILGSSYTAEKTIVNGLAKDIKPIIKDEAGKFIEKLPITRTGKILSTINAIRPYTFSTSEAFEEGAQYAIQVGVQDYYNKKYKGQAADFAGSLAEGLNKTLTTNEGMENVLIGGLSGALMLGKSRYQEAKERGLNTVQAIEAFNKWKLSDFTKDTIDSINRGTALQEEREAAIKAGDKLEAKDLDQDYIINYLTPRIKYGREDLIKSDINDLRAVASTDEGFAQLQSEGKALSTDTKEKFIARLTSVENTVNTVKSLYQSLNLRYSGVVDKEGNQVYSPEVIDKMVYAATKVDDYDKRIPLLATNLMLKGIDTTSLTNNLVEGKSEEYNKALSQIEKLDIDADKKEDLIKDLQDISELSLRRQKFLKEYSALKATPEAFKTTEPVIKSESNTPETVKIKTKDGEKDINVGEEYYLGKVVEYDSKGNEVYRFPRITILGENPDGTIKIKASNGTVKDISKAELADYKLGKVADVVNNENANFYLRNINKVVFWNTGKKKSGKLAGRLVYDSKNDKLYFVYKQNNKIKEKEIGIDQFEPKEGYTEGLFSFGATLVAEDLKDIKKRKDSGKTQQDKRDRRGDRLKILTDLFNELTDKHTATKKLISQKQAELKNTVEELNELEEKVKGSEFTKKGKFKKASKAALEAARRLSRMQEQLENELQALQSEADELEINASYVADLSDNIDELPTDSKEFLQELKDQKNLLEDLMLETGKEINTISKLIDNVQSALDTAVNYLRDVLNEFKKKYPKVPLALGEEWVTFLQENPNFLKLKPDYKADLKQAEDIISQVEDLDITPNERTLGELRGELKTLQSNLSEIEKELKAKDLILSKFQEVADKYKVQKAEEEKAANDVNLRKQLLGTNSNDVQNNVDEKEYQPEAKKSDINVVTGTVPVDDSIPYQERVNRFGVKYHSLPNKDRIKGIHVTTKTENFLIPGLINHLIKDAKAPVDADQVIALVLVQENENGTYTLINENGDPIEGDDLLNQAIYQVKPLPELQKMYNGKKETMFRSFTPEYVKDALTKQYAAERQVILSQVQLGDALTIDASFGQLEYVKTVNDKGESKIDYDARTSAEDADLIKSSDLVEKRVIKVGTTNDAVSSDNGTVTFMNALGRVFLNVPGGLVKLINSKFNKKKAETIYKVVYQLSKEAISEEGIKSQKAKNLIDWLKSVVYWGVPKNDTGYNSIWFKEVVENGVPQSKLFISGKGANYTFTPSSLEMHKDEIIALLEGMYHNTNATMVNENSYNEPYYEITDIDKEGNIVTQEWENYQTYLLSGKGRDAKDIPLATRVAPVKGTDKLNRKGIYFITTSSSDNYVIPTAAPKATPAPKKEAEKQEKKPEAPNTNLFVYDGTTKNTIPTPISNINFAANKEGKIFFFQDEKGKLDEETQKYVDNLAKTKNITEDKAKAIIYASIENKIASDIAAFKIPVTTPLLPAKIEVKVTTEAPTAKSPAEIKNPFEQDETVAPDDNVYRLKLVEEIKNFEGENWQKIETFLKANFPNIPVYRVKNIIKATNGRQAWGMLHNGAIYLYQNAEVGTVYHEVFEAVWKMFSSPQEQKDVINEFKQRKGSFVDRPTGQSIEYSKATPEQIKEQLAEEFRDYILYNKMPVKPSQGKPFIVKLFYDLFQFLKEFFLGENAPFNTEKLFKQIGNGYYKNYVPYEAPLSFAKEGIIDIDDVISGPDSEFRIANIPATQIHEIMQQMTYSTLTSLTKSDKSLFSIPKINKKELYDSLKLEITNLIKHRASLVAKALELKEITAEEASSKFSDLKYLHDIVQSEWVNIAKKHEEEYLKQYSIEFDENDNTIQTDENNSGKEDYVDARKVDGFRKANSAIKLLLATLAETQEVNGKPSLRRSSIHGAILMPLDMVFITLMNNLHTATSLEDMLLKLKQFAKDNKNYAALYTRLTKNDVNSESIDYSKLTSEHNINLLAAFWKTFKKQNPDVKTVFVLPSGEVVIGDSNLSSAAKQSKQDMFNDVISALKDAKNPYVEYNKKTKTYEATKVIKDYKLNPSKTSTYTAFLGALGIEVTEQELRKLKPNQLAQFRQATEGVLKSISKIEGLKDVNKYTLDLEGRLLELGSIRAILDNPEFESTYFNISGERTQTYIGTNSVSNLYDVIAKIKNKKELVNTPYAYLLTDEFTQGSVLLDAIFNPETGNKREGAENFLKTGYVNGIVDEAKGKQKDPSKYNFKQRLIQEMNLNHTGWYLNLIPGDASIEHTNYVGNHISKQAYNNNGHFKIFKNYFLSELEVARENRTIVKVGDRKPSDLRFFKEILGTELHKEIIAKDNNTLSPEEVYTKYESKINTAVNKFIKEKAVKTRESLEKYDIIYDGEKGLEVDGLYFLDENPTEDDVKVALEVSTANYIVANVEFHKLIYSDPYFYKDELKRIKNFNSPGQALLANSPAINQQIQQVFNRGYSKKSIGWTDFTRDYFRSSVIDDVFSVADLPEYAKPYEETDGGGYITAKANRNFKIRSGDWTEDNEKQYRFDVAFEKEKKGQELTKEEKELLEKGNPAVKSTYTPIKPIVRGSKKDGENYNDIVLDKFALVPLSYRILWEINPDSNAIKHYDKMQKEDVDYTVYSTGRKVGAGITTPLYNKDGAYNQESFNEINNIPFEIMAVQTEVPSKDSNNVTIGSQVTKLVSMDYVNNGVPIDYKDKEDWNTLSEEKKEKVSPIYKEIKNNQLILEESIKEGYKSLLERLGLSKTDEGFEISDKDKMIDALKSEIFKREVNDNIVDAFDGYRKGDVILEATPAYQQIRNILYSIADKSVVRRKISGGQKVQIPSTLLESVRAKQEKGAYTSDVLRFYEDKDGKRVCEMMVGRWFDSDLSDKELLDYLNNTKEGQAVLGGIGFRIPTQKQNSIDVFKIKQFLPKEFGDSVVVPSALVKKVGSDFDIDKLSIYLKNVYKDLKGNIKLVPFLGYGEQAKKKLGEMYDEGAFLTDEDRATVHKWIKNRKAEDKDPATEALFIAIYGERRFEESYEQEVVDDLLDAKNDKEFREKVINQKYKESLENAYIASMEQLVSHPLNFSRLITPNSADQLKSLSKEIVKKTNSQDYDYGLVGNMLDRQFMSNLRQDFLTGKYAIGIAATSQTNHAQNQRTQIFIDTDKLAELPDADRKWLGTGDIKFKEYNTIEANGKKRPSLSGVKNASGDYISDIIGQFIDGYVDISKGPWIMQMGATPNVAGTWLFLTKLGVPIKTIGYFMNQPIVRDYLRSIENSGYVYLFMDDFVKRTKEIYPSKDKSLVDFPSETALEKMLGKSADQLSEAEKMQQQLILDEFLKYAKMAEHLFLVQQATNFDTATLNDPYLIFKKVKQLDRVAKNNIISSADKLIKNSFIGELKNAISDVRNAFSSILISDQKKNSSGGSSIREVLEAVLTPYLDTPDRDFVRISQKAVADMFDWAVQTDQGLNSKVKEILLGTDIEQSAANKVMSFVNKVKKDPTHPLHNNYIINSIKRSDASSKENTPNNLALTAKSNKVYDQNQVIYGFNELKAGMKDEDANLYDKLVALSVLQSGLVNSKISFTSLLPYEDFQNIYNKTLSILNKMPNLAEFKNLNVFERNNWNNSDIVPFIKSKPFKSKKGNWIFNRELKFVDRTLQKATDNKKIPQTISISNYSREAKNDVIVYSWEPYITKEKKKELRKKGDYSYIKKGLFKKVYNSEGNPLTTTYTSPEGREYVSFVYKAINAWGDSFKANEFYSTPEQSVIDNGYIKVEKEVTDDVIEAISKKAPITKKAVKIEDSSNSTIPNCA